MKLRAPIFFILIFLSFSTKAQDCLLRDLSKKFDYRVVTKRIKGEMFDSAKIQLRIYRKDRLKPSQTISLTAKSLYENAYSDCSSVRSSVTGKNWTAVVSDYNYGDLIISDLNFDGLEDIAIKNDSGGNGGPYYNFYVQNANGHFTLSKYLTTNMESFPANINDRNNTLTTQIHANVHQEQQNTFKYNKTTGKWRFVKHRLVDFGE